MIIVSYPIEDNLESMDGYMEKLELLTNADLEQMLNAMPQGYKTIFLMYVIEEYSHKGVIAWNQLLKHQGPSYF